MCGMRSGDSRESVVCRCTGGCLPHYRSRRVSGPSRLRGIWSSTLVYEWEIGFVLGAMLALELIGKTGPLEGEMGTLEWCSFGPKRGNGRAGIPEASRSRNLARDLEVWCLRLCPTSRRPRNLGICTVRSPWKFI